MSENLTCGDRWFLIAAYKKLQAKVERFGFLHAEDALGDAFLQLWQGDYHPKGAAEGERLLGSSMRRRQISFWRSDKRHPQTPLTDTQIAEPPPDDETEETFKKIWELINSQLTPLQQDILKRHDINDESYSEIAESLGMQEAAVRMQLSRARKKIREIYKMKNGE